MWRTAIVSVLLLLCGYSAAAWLTRDFQVWTDEVPAPTRMNELPEHWRFRRETVSVGQSETAVADMVDMFIVLLLPAGGDDLQGIKRGVIELADLIVVNKADGDLKTTAQRSASDYQHALRMLRSPTAGWTPEVTTCSALAGDGVAEIWQTIERFRTAVGEKGVARRRAEQARAWMWNEVGETLLAELRRHPDVKKLVPGLEREVEGGRTTPAAAARLMLEAFHGR